MSSPIGNTLQKLSGSILETLFKFRRRRSYSDHLLYRDGSSRHGRRKQEISDDRSVGKDSSTHSALFDLDLSTRGRQTISEADWQNDGRAELQGKLRRIAYLARPLAQFEMELLHDVEALRHGCGLENNREEFDVGVLVQELTNLGYTCLVEMKRKRDLGIQVEPQSAPSQLHCHAYIVCTGKNDGSLSCHCIVDPHFRDQFCIAKPTESYAFLLKTLPSSFVGSPLRLQKLASLMAAEIAEVYRQQHLPLPPWRHENAILSHWFDAPGASNSQAEYVVATEEAQHGKVVLATIDEASGAHLRERV